MKLSEILDLREEMELSLLCDVSQLQDSFLFRAQYRARKIAEYVVGDDGKVVRERLGLFEGEGYFFYPNGEKDCLIREHQSGVLKNLNVKLLERFLLPLCHKGAERLVRDSLGLEDSVKLENKHVRRAVLAAMLGMLRQNLGSCFATAFAIMVHGAHPDQFLKDMDELLSAGRLRRVFGGVEYSVPLSLSTGFGDLKRKIGPNARFSPGLIGFDLVGSDAEECIHRTVLKRHKMSAEKYEAEVKKGVSLSPFTPPPSVKIIEVQREERDAKAAFKGFTDNPLLKAWEYTLASFSEVKMEFSKWNLYSSLGLNPEEKGGLGQVLYKFTQGKLEECNQKIGEYQREYEGAFHQIKFLQNQAKEEKSDAYVKAQYAASYHHMRSCEDLRDKFHSKGSYLANFYNFMLEKFSEQFKEYFQELYDPEMQDFKEGIYDDAPAGFRLVYKHGRADATLWTSIHNQEEWINALIDFFKRVEPACAHEVLQEEVSEVISLLILHLRTKEFLETAFKRMGQKKPWAYISGGTTETLVRTYAKREGALTEEKRVVDSPSDLLTFLIDVLKSVPATDMLMYSPTHAFILKPGFELFKEAWQDRGFTYTWIRDQYLLPRQEYYAKVIGQKAFVHGNLFQSLPIVHKKDWKDKALELLENREFLPFIEKQTQFLDQIIPADVFMENIFACVMNASPKRTPSFPFDLYHALVAKARAKGLLAPAPLIFADTNWTRDYFSFVVNPNSNELELWRVDYTGTKGTPMSIWNKWLDGSHKQPWGIYTKPYEYGI